MHQDHAPSQPPSPAPAVDGALAALRRAAATVAPRWPLVSYVAVNPDVGVADRRFEDVAHRLAAAGGIRSTLPASWYLARLDEGRITRDDVE
ncbi:MAG: putative inorganic carbon transporter subunit DabA, partial [Acidimicrobiia bacterium]